MHLLYENISASAIVPFSIKMSEQIQIQHIRVFLMADRDSRIDVEKNQRSFEEFSADERRQETEQRP